MIKSVDIFCAVIDNYGDIGVCWRLARQMAIERGLITRLYVDDMDSFKAIIPAPDAPVEVLSWASQDSGSRACQHSVGMHPRDDEIKGYNAPDLVIEAFACNLPEQVIADMVRQKSVWIDLEYLTAENWALGCHARPSPHPSLNIKKTLFFPGFDENIGGLIRENDLISRRNAFFQDKNEQNKWRKAHFIPEIEGKLIDISLFSYKKGPIDDLLGGLQALERKVRVFRPVREFKPQIVDYGENVKLIDIPFLPQYEYDYLLWTCDINFVRGEDSFVRAQFAGKPFIWNIYPQEKNAHLVKMDAFLKRIKAFYDESSFESLANLHDLWNEGGRNSNIKPKDLWRNSLQSFVGLTTGARAWTDYLVTQTDLCTSLLAFAETQKVTKIDKD